MISHLASDVQRNAMAEMGRRNSSMTQQFTMHARAPVSALLDGLTLVSTAATSGRHGIRRA